MIEKLTVGMGNTKPCREVLNCIKQMKDKKKTVIVGEIGVDLGATAVEILKLLKNPDEYHFFDRESKTRELLKDFNSININGVQLYEYGNTDKIYDYYGWQLCKLYKMWKSNFDTVERFDVVYLDGAHTFIHDSGTAAILKEMITPGGYIILDDIDWKMRNSPTCNPAINPEMSDKYTDEQIDTCQVQLVAEMILETDKRFVRWTENNSRIRGYIKIKV